MDQNIEEDPDDENPTIVYIVWAVLGAIILYAIIKAIV
jgi:hypothetical protein